MSAVATEIMGRLTEKFGDVVKPVASTDQPTVSVPRERLLECAEYLKTAEGYVMFNDVLVVDWFPSRPRFEVVYQVYHPENRTRFRFKSFVAEDEPIPSVTSLWAGANWPEREAYDLFGVVFTGHPELTRIYLPDDWEGHPLRKDYPTSGNRID